MIRPAVNGVVFVMEAAAKYKVKRVVITSSGSAVSAMSNRPKNGVYDESCWSDVVAYAFSAYTVSKTLSEKAAWDFLKNKVDHNEFCPEIVAICPTLILGEVIGSGDMTSAAIVKRMLLN